METREKIFKEINEERLRQDDKWGDMHVQASMHSPTDWATILGEEYGEACQEFLRVKFDPNVDNRPSHIESLKAELVQVAAVAVVILEAIEEGYLERWRS